MEQYVPPIQGEWGYNTVGRSLKNYRHKKEKEENVRVQKNIAAPRDDKSEWLHSAIKAYQT